MSASAPQEPLGTVAGRVTGAVTGYAVEGYRIQADRTGEIGGTATDLTFPSGSYQLELPAGRYTIRAYAPGAHSARPAGEATDVEVAAGTTTTADITVSETVTRTAEPSSGWSAAWAGTPVRPGPAPDVRSTPEIDEIIGPEELAVFRQAAIGTRFTCWRCEQDGPDTSGAISLVVLLDRDGITARFAHAACTPPRIVELDDSSMLVEPRSDQDADAPVCQADEVTATLSWRRDGQALTGQVTVTNTGSRTCRLPGKADVRPLDASGLPLRVPSRRTEEFMLPGFAIVRPGQRATATVRWRSWCGP